MGSILLTNLIVIALLMTSLWAFSLWKRDASIIDIFWGIGFVVIAVLTSVQVDELSSVGLLITALVGIWGLRLSAYLAWRNLGKPEDYLLENDIGAIPE